MTKTIVGWPKSSAKFLILAATSAFFLSSCSSATYTVSKSTPISVGRSGPSQIGSNWNLVNQLPTVTNETSDTVRVPSQAATIQTWTLFATNQYTLTDSANPILTTLLKEIRNYEPNANVKFIGHADSRGNASANLVLSEKRALAIKNWFEQHGYPGSKLSSMGDGSTNLPYPDFDSQGHFIPSAGARDRRVDVVLSR